MNETHEIQWHRDHDGDGICGQVCDTTINAHCWVGNDGTFSVIIHASDHFNRLLVRGEGHNTETGQHHCQAVINAHAQTEKK